MRINTRTLLAAAITVLLGAPVQAASPEADYSAFQALLDAHLTEETLADGGLVSAFDYSAALDDSETVARLQTQRRILADFDPQALASREAAIAFWINAYNFFMLAHIVENPVNGALVDGVKDYGNFFSPYRVFSRDIFNIGGRNYSLSEMEKEILLGDDYKAKGWKDARVHFAVNCASVGCPPLRSTIYTADNVDALLTENTRRALNTPYHLRRDGNTLYLTQLFEWYEADYAEEAGSVRDWLLRYADEDTRRQIEATSQVRYIAYDWTLNRPENFPELAR